MNGSSQANNDRPFLVSARVTAIKKTKKRRFCFCNFFKKKKKPETNKNSISSENIPDFSQLRENLSLRRVGGTTIPEKQDMPDQGAQGVNQPPANRLANNRNNLPSEN